MLRTVLPLILLPGLFVPIAASAPSPKGETSNYYFPTSVGAKRVYQSWRYVFVWIAWGGQKRSEAVTKVEKKDGLAVVSINNEENGKLVGQPVQYRISDHGIFALTNSDGKTLEHPACELQLPARKGDSWVRGEETWMLDGEEEIEVPAGKFKTIRIRITRSNSDEIATLWYARGVGRVKVIFEHLPELRYVEMLQSFTPGEK